MRIVVFVLLLFACAVRGYAQEQELSFADRAMQNMVRFSLMCPQEKLYLHTDRDHYNAGEKVWFRAYLVHAVTHRQDARSNYVYVELVDRCDSVFSRVKIVWRDSVFEGNMPLPAKLARGDYYLRAYTYWMQNNGDAFIPRKKIRVMNPADSRVETTLSYEQDKGVAVAKINFTNSRNEVYGKVFVEHIQNNKLKISRTDEAGNIFIKLDSNSHKTPMLVKFKDEDPFTFERWLFLVDLKKDFDVTFCPEGGDLLAGNTQAVAFKAVGANGLSCDVSGGVFNDKDEQVVWIQSLHQGMGGFQLQVEPGRHYYAVVSTADGQKKRFELPRPKHYGLGLKVMMNDGILGYAILSGDSVRMPGDLHILLHSGGVPLLCIPVGERLKGRILLDKTPEGILHVLLMDTKGEVYSERLCFVHGKRPEIAVETDKSAYRVRDLVNLKIKVLTDSLMQRGYFSMAVTDDSRCERDSTGGNILSSLLLTSDLKGYVEDPGFYFRNDWKATQRCLDLLLLTQGWSRFNVPEVALGKLEEAQYYMECGQAVSGRVKNFWGKDAKDANLIMLATNGVVRMVDADSAGYFVVDGITFPDSTRFVVQARSKKGRRSVEVLMDKDEFMKPQTHIPYDERVLAEEDDFYKKFQKDYYYDHGVKVYLLDEVEVKQKPPKKIYSFYDVMADYNLDSARIAAMGDRDIRFVLQELPGVEFFDNSVTCYGKKLYVLVNDIEENIEYVRMIQSRDLLSVSVIRPPMSSAYFGQEAANGALVITVNPNFVPYKISRLNMAQFTLLGYQKKAEFYMPHYEVDSIRRALVDSLDQRETVYWNPNIRTDENGEAECFFTTSDSGGPYSVVIEGILRDGTICRKEEKVVLNWK